LARLALVGDDVVEIARVAVGAEDGAPQRTLLPLMCSSGDHDFTLNAAGRTTAPPSAGSGVTSRASTIALTSVSMSRSTCLMRVSTVPRFFQPLSCARFSST